MSCLFGLSPRPFTISPFSVSDVLLGQVVRLAVQVVDARGDDDAFRVLPRAAPDAVARIDRLRAAHGAVAEVSAPHARAARVHRLARASGSARPRRRVRRGPRRCRCRRWSRKGHRVLRLAFHRRASRGDERNGRQQGQLGLLVHEILRGLSAAGGGTTDYFKARALQSRRRGKKDRLHRVDP